MTQEPQSPLGSVGDDLERLAREAADLLGGLERDVRQDERVKSAFSSIDEWAKALQLSNGQWCGPGNDPTAVATPIDPCCETHDGKYDSLGLDFNTMWTIRAILQTRDADQWLVNCVSGVPTDGMDDVTEAYRVGLLAAFEGRVAIADWLTKEGYKV